MIRPFQIKRGLFPFVIFLINLAFSGCGGGGGGSEGGVSNPPSGFPSGTPDATFGSGGTVMTAMAMGSDQANGVAVQPDGKILVVGRTFNGLDTDLLLLRYLPDGTPDSTFGIEGRVVTDFFLSDDSGSVVALNSAGGIIVAGYTNNVGNAYDTVLVRYQNTGEIDPTFGSGGVARVSFLVNDDYPADLAIRSDGKMLVAGNAFNGNNHDFAVALVTDSGSLDGAFGIAGKVTTPIGAAEDLVFSMTLLPGDEVLLAGDSFNGTNFDFAMARYSNTGTLSSGFGSGGKVVAPVGATHEAIRAVAMQNGKIVAAGFVYNAGQPDLALARYNIADGSLDFTFGSNGIAIHPIGTGDDLAFSLRILSDNKIQISGEAFNGADADFLTARFDEDGALDVTFGNAGTVLTDFNGSEDTSYAVAIQSDGKILAAGQSFFNGNKDLALARYEINGTLDPLFKMGGKQTLDLEKSNAVIDALAIQADGKILAAGGALNGDNSAFVVIRYTAGGEIDPTFGTEGRVVTPLDGGKGGKVAIRPDGKIFVAGTLFQNGDNDFGLARYGKDGAYEGLATVGFGPGGGTNEDFLSALAIQTDGKVLLAGSTYTINSSVNDSLNNYDFTLVRLNPEGGFDSSFGAAGARGRVTFPIGAGDDVVTSIALQADGRILLGGYSITGVVNNVPAANVSLARYHADGSVDLSFGKSGKILTPVGPSGIAVANAVRIQTDGKIVVGGYTLGSENLDFALLRYDSDGGLDLTFGNLGKVIAAIDSGDDGISDLAIQEDGKIVAAGFSNVNDSDFSVARFNPNGSPDTSFGNSGAKTLPIGLRTDYINAVLIQPDGKIVAGGGALNGTHYEFALARFWP